MTIHVQVSLHYQPEGVEWDVHKTACGRVVPENTINLTRIEKDADCKKCKRALIDQL